MSRLSGGDMIPTKPQNNIYTVLVIVATLAVILGLVVLFVRGTTLYGDGWLFK